MQRTRFTAIPLQVNRDKLGHEQIARLRLLVIKIPSVVDAHLRSESVLLDHRFVPRSVVHFHHLRDPRETEVIARGADQIEHLVVRQNEIHLRAFQLHRRHQVGLGAHFVFGAELVLKSCFRRHEVHAVGSACIQRDPRGKPSVCGLHERDRAALFPLLQSQLGRLHLLIRFQHEIHLGPVKAHDRTVRLGHRAVRELAVFRVMIRLFKRSDERPFPRIEQIVAGDCITRFDAIAHAFAPHINRRSKAIATKWLHVHRLPSVLRSFSDDPGLVRPLAAEHHEHTNRVALRHEFVSALGLHDHHFRARDAVEIG